MTANARRGLGVGCFAPRERLLRVLARMAPGPPDRPGGFACGEQAAFGAAALPPGATGFFLEQTAAGLRLFVFERNRPGGRFPQAAPPRPAGGLSGACGSATEPANPVRREEAWTSAGST